MSGTVLPWYVSTWLYRNEFGAHDQYLGVWLQRSRIRCWSDIAPQHRRYGASISRFLCSMSHSPARRLYQSTFLTFNSFQTLGRIEVVYGRSSVHTYKWDKRVGLALGHLILWLHSQSITLFNLLYHSYECLFSQVSRLSRDP